MLYQGKKLLEVLPRGKLYVFLQIFTAFIELDCFQNQN